MALKTAGIPARDYENDCPTIAVKLYEGNLVYNANGIDEEGRTTDMWTVSAPMNNPCMWNCMRIQMQDILSFNLQPKILLTL